MERGPFNLVFHGIKPDWIEEEMDDDPEFKRDVLEQKIRNIIRQEVRIENTHTSFPTINNRNLYGYFKIKHVVFDTQKNPLDLQLNCFAV